MSVSAQKKAGIGVAVLAVLCLAGWFIVVPMLEREQVKKIEELLASLPGEVKAERIEASLFDKTVALTGFSGAFTDSASTEYSLYAAEIVFSGINYGAAAADAVTKILDSAAFTDVTVGMDGPGMRQSFTVGEWKVNDVAVNLFSLLACLRAEEKPSVLRALGTLRMGSSSYVNYRISMDMGFGPLVINASSGALAESSIWSAEGAVINDVSIGMMGMDIGRLDKVSLRSLSVPDVTEGLERLAGKDDFESSQEAEAFMDEMRGLFKAQSLRVEGLECSGLTLRSMFSEPITLARAAFDLNFNFENLLFTHSIDSLVLPEDVLLTMFPAQDVFFADYAKPLRLSGRSTFRIGEKNGRLAISVSDAELSDPDLGKATLLLELSGDLPEGASPLLTPGDADEMFLDTAQLSLTDKGVLQAVYKAIFAEEQPEGVSDVTAFRKAQADTLAQVVFAGDAAPDRAAFARNVADFIRDSGSIRLKVVPLKPISVDELLSGRLPHAKIRLESEHSTE